MANLKNLEAVINLAAKTGDRVIVVSEDHEPFVIMSLSNYQALLPKNAEIKDLNQQEMLDKINRDIAIWRSSQVEVPVSDDYSLDQFKVDSNKNEPSVNTAQIKIEPIVTEEEEKYYIEPVD